jgi:Flp pilus assembly protein TadG
VIAVAMVLVLAGLVAFGTAELGVAMVQRQRAQLAADAAALAGLEGGPSAAARLAGANGGRLAWFRRVGDVVTVEVGVGPARAVARASDGP